MKVTNKKRLTAKVQLLWLFTLMLMQVMSLEIVEYVAKASSGAFSSSSDQPLDLSLLQDDLIVTGIELHASDASKNQWLRLDLKETVRVGAFFLFTDEIKMQSGKI